MGTTLFLQSEVQDPYKIYEAMLNSHPVYWDSSNNLWAVHSYEACKMLLRNPFAHIPATNPGNKDGLNSYALLLTRNLARLNNGIQHEMAKQAVELLFDNKKSIATNDIMEKLISGTEKGEIDWVNSICKKLPLMAVLESFDFNKKDFDFILSKIEALVKNNVTKQNPGTGCCNQ